MVASYCYSSSSYLVQETPKGQMVSWVCEKCITTLFCLCCDLIISFQFSVTNPLHARENDYDLPGTSTYTNRSAVSQNTKFVMFKNAIIIAPSTSLQELFDVNTSEGNSYHVLW